LYAGATGVGNSFYDNISYNNPGGFGHLTAVASYGNVVGKPLFVNAAAHDFQIQPSSPGAGWNLWNGQ
jgi:hypothetical protein